MTHLTNEWSNLNDKSSDINLVFPQLIIHVYEDNNWSNHNRLVSKDTKISKTEGMLQYF